MSFGKNPHVAKAESAEQKARDARDEFAREQAWLEAARRWERAAEREADGKRKQLYIEKCEHARQQASGGEAPASSDDEPSAAAEPGKTLLN